MGYLDPQIENLRRLLSGPDLGPGARITNVEKDLPSCFPPDGFRGDQEKGPAPAGGFVSREDTELELGPPTLPSVNLLLWTDTVSLLHRDQVTIAGRDLNELPRGSHPYAQVFLVAGSKLKDQDESGLAARISSAQKLSGVMLRAARERVWIRMKKEVIDRGLTFPALGRLVFTSLYRDLPAVEAAEAVFITPDRDRVEKLGDFYRQVQAARREKIKERFKELGDGLYECDLTLDCESCPDKPVCDIIRETAQVIKKRRADFFGKDNV